MQRAELVLVSSRIATIMIPSCLRFAMYKHANNNCYTTCYCNVSKTHYIYALLLWRGLSFKSLLQPSVAEVLLCLFRETVHFLYKRLVRALWLLNLAVYRRTQAFTHLTLGSLGCLSLAQGSGAWSRVSLLGYLTSSLFLTTLLSDNY